MADDDDKNRQTVNVLAREIESWKGENRLLFNKMLSEWQENQIMLGQSALKESSLQLKHYF